jgi:hypothetical protein
VVKTHSYVHWYKLNIMVKNGFKWYIDLNTLYESRGTPGTRSSIEGDHTIRRAVRLSFPMLLL